MTSIPSHVASVLQLRPSLKGGKVWLTGYPRLTPALESDLLEVWQQHESPFVRDRAREAILLLHMRLVASTVRKLACKAPWLTEDDLEDLVQAGMGGVVDALERYDEAKLGEGSRFFSYAHAWAIKRIAEAHIAKSLVAVPSVMGLTDGRTHNPSWLLKECGTAIRRMEDRGKSVTKESLAEAVGVTADVAWAYIHLWWGQWAPSPGDSPAVSQIPGGVWQKDLDRADLATSMREAIREFRSGLLARDGEVFDAIVSPVTEGAGRQRQSELKQGIADKHRLTRQAIHHNYRDVKGRFRRFLVRRYPGLVELALGDIGLDAMSAPAPSPHAIENALRRFRETIEGRREEIALDAAMPLMGHLAAHGTATTAMDPVREKLGVSRSTTRKWYGDMMRRLTLWLERHAPELKPAILGGPFSADSSEGDYTP